MGECLCVWEERGSKMRERGKKCSAENKTNPREENREYICMLKGNYEKWKN